MEAETADFRNRGSYGPLHSERDLITGFSHSQYRKEVRRRLSVASESRKGRCRSHTGPLKERGQIHFRMKVTI